MGRGLAPSQTDSLLASDTTPVAQADSADAVASRSEAPMIWLSPIERLVLEGRGGLVDFVIVIPIDHCNDARSGGRALLMTDGFEENFNDGTKRPVTVNGSLIRAKPLIANINQCGDGKIRGLCGLRLLLPLARSAETRQNTP